jgi:Tfp pilus assembly protein PilE
MAVNIKYSLRKAESGFTLVEVLTVAGMIALLATVALASMHRSREAAYEAQAIGALRTLASMEYTYFFRHKEFASWDELKAEGDLLDMDYNKFDDLDEPFDHPIALGYSLHMITTPMEFTIIAYPVPRPRLNLREFKIGVDGAVEGAGFQLNPTGGP